MEAQVSKICQSAYFHLRNINSIKHILSPAAIEKLVHAFITSRLDNGNALLYGISQSSLRKLQRVQYAAARVVSGAHRFADMKEILKKLHWLPVKERISYKILLLTFKALNGMAPAYISELLKLKDYSHNLRSSNSKMLDVPKTRLKTYGDRAFYKVAPTLWNVLPRDLRCAEKLTTFKAGLKKYLFNVASKRNDM